MKQKDVFIQVKSKLGKTICVQPGQSNQHESYLIYVIIDLEAMNFKRFKVNKED